jgi:hypothetical protein
LFDGGVGDAEPQCGVARSKEGRHLTILVEIEGIKPTKIHDPMARHCDVRLKSTGSP